MRQRIISDPVEWEVAKVLDAAGVDYIHQSEDSEATKRLDFYISAYDVYIECKAFHTDRIGQQMARAKNVITIQGVEAARLLNCLRGAKC